MPSGKFLFNRLTKEQKSKYSANCGIRFEYNMSMYCEDLRDFILMSFTWKDTPEGRDYWFKIANSER